MSVGLAQTLSPLKNNPCAPLAGAGTKPVPPAASAVAALNTPYLVSEEGIPNPVISAFVTAATADI